MEDNVFDMLSNALAAVKRKLKQLDQVYTVTSCPGPSGGPEIPLPLPFVADCTNVANPEDAQMCSAMIRKTACESFPALREITGVKLESGCKQLTYRFWDDDVAPSWGHFKKHNAVSRPCEVLAHTLALGAWSMNDGEHHELLHQHQFLVPKLPTGHNAHHFFSTTIAEVYRTAGPQALFEEQLKFRESEVKELEGPNPPIERPSCEWAQQYLEVSLYLKDTTIVRRYYRNVAADIDNPELQLSHILYASSGHDDKVRKLLLDNGCSKDFL